MKKILIILLCIFLQNVPAQAEKNDITNLIKLLGGSDRRTIEQASQKLKKLGSSAVPALIQVLNDNKSNINLCINSILTLGNIGPDANEAVPVLIERIEDKNYLIRKASAYALGSIDPANERVISALIHALHDINEFKHLPDSTIQPLISALNDSNNRIRISAIRSLGNVCTPNDKVMTSLTEATNDENNEVSATAKETLKKIKARKDLPIQCD